MTPGLRVFRLNFGGSVPATVLSGKVFLGGGGPSPHCVAGVEGRRQQLQGVGPQFAGIAVEQQQHKAQRRQKGLKSPRGRRGGQSGGSGKEEN